MTNVFEHLRNNLDLRLKREDDVAVAYKELPAGWHDLYNEMTLLAQHMPNGGKITQLEIAKGLLRVYGTMEDSALQKLFDRHAQAIAKASATTCMLCGLTGRRRKLEELWPVLCGPHYVEYLNYFDQHKE